MKKLEIITRPEKLSQVKNIINEAHANGLMVSNVMGYGAQKGKTMVFRGTQYTPDMLSKIKVETVVTDEIANEIIDKLVHEISTGNYGDGKIFVYEVVDAIRVRTGEQGEDVVK